MTQMRCQELANNLTHLKDEMHNLNFSETDRKERCSIYFFIVWHPLFEKIEICYAMKLIQVSQILLQQKKNIRLADLLPIQ